MVKISACVITKNEEKNIRQWLASVREIANEYIVVDTGSTDKTVALAEEGGAKVVYFPWINDFSAAKNFALEQASGEWVIFLDADEQFSPSSLKKVKINILKFHPQRKILGLACRLLNLDQDRQGMVVDSAIQVRIFRNLRSLRYTGKIHEALQYCSGNKKLQIQLLSDVEIYHTGYSSNIVRNKLQRNLVLLEEKISQQGGERPEDYHYLMDCYFGLGEYGKAREYAKKSIEKKIKFVGIEGREYIVLVKCMIFLKEPNLKILSTLEKAQEQYPGVADFFFLKAFVLWTEQDYLKVQETAEKGIELWQSECKVTKLGQTGSSARLASTGYFYLGKIHQLRFNKNQALEYFLSGLKLVPRDTEIFSAMYECIEELPAVDIIQFLNSFYNRDTDAVFLAGVLRRVGAGIVYQYYRKRIKDEKIIDRTVAYQIAGRYDAAVTQLAEEIDWISRLGVWSAVQKELFPAQAELSLLLPKKYIEKWKKDLGVQKHMRVEKITKEKNLPDKDVAEAVRLFSIGDSVSALALLQTALQGNPGDAILTYGLATLLQLIGKNDAARRALLQGSTPLAEARDLWNELKNDEAFPLVSIMIPTYNRPKLFEETLKSAVAQTYTNLEILVCDNSTDNSTEILMNKYVKDLRVRYYRNKGAKTKAENFQPFEELAQGEYIQWLMDDDILHPEKIAKMVVCFQENSNVTLVTSDRGAIDADGKHLPKPYSGFLDIQDEYSIYPGELIHKMLLLNRANFIGEPSAVLFRRKQLRHHYWHAECRGYKTISDIVMWLDLLEQGDCAIFKESLSYYRKHDGQEGGQPNTILLSRIEWSCLLEEEYKQGYLSEDDYLQGQLALCKEQVDFTRVGLDKLAAKTAWQQYIDCMNAIGELSFS